MDKVDLVCGSITAAVIGTIIGLLGAAYMISSEAHERGFEKGQQQLRQEAIAFGAAHLGPKGQFMWGPVTRRELEVAR